MIPYVRILVLCSFNDGFDAQSTKIITFDWSLGGGLQYNFGFSGPDENFEITGPDEQFEIAGAPIMIQ